MRPEFELGRSFKGENRTVSIGQLKSPRGQMASDQQVVLEAIQIAIQLPLSRRRSYSKSHQGGSEGRVRLPFFRSTLERFLASVMLQALLQQAINTAKWYVGPPRRKLES